MIEPWSPRDLDFLDGYLLNDAPRRLLLVTTGNIHNNDLITLIEAVEPLLVEAFEHSVLVDNRHLAGMRSRSLIASRLIPTR